MKCAFQAILAGAVICSLAGSLKAGSTNELAPTCASRRLQTLQDYLNLDGECSIGILNFSGFTFSRSGSARDALYSASQISVDPVFFGNSVGFSFSHFGGGQFQVGAGLTAQYVIDYTYVIDAGPVSTGADLGVDPPFGNFVIRQEICADSHLIFIAGGAAQCSVFSNFSATTLPQTLSVDNSNPPRSLTAHLDLNPPVLSFATIQDTITLDGSQGSAGFDSLMSTGTVVNSSPEPFSSVLCISGLLAVVVRKRLAG